MSADTDASISPSAQAETLKNEGNALYKRGIYSKAIEKYSQAVDLAPANAIYLNNRAAAYVMQKEWSLAAQDCAKAVALDPTFAKAMVRGAKCLLLMDQLQEADSLLQRAFAISPTGLIQADRNVIARVRESLAAYRTAIASDQNDAALKAMDAAIRAVTAADSSVSSSDVPMKWRLYRGEALARTGSVDEASQIAIEGLRSDSTSPEALALRGRVFYLQGESGKAQAHLQQALAYDPDMKAARVLFRLVKQVDSVKEAGNAAFKRGDLDEAVAKYTDALALDPTAKNLHSKLYSNRAMVLAKQGKLREAIADCDAALEIDPQFYKVLLRRADCYSKTEQWEAAARDYKTAMDIEPTAELRQAAQNADRQARLASRKDHYKTLGVERNASEDEIRRAYRYD
ncbi:hypothetical protein BC828DRAFT_407907, partial [Blastocladiella britannica]